MRLFFVFFHLNMRNLEYRNQFYLYLKLIVTVLIGLIGINNPLIQNSDTVAWPRVSRFLRFDFHRKHQ